jgi:DNA-binding transcriptional regulator YiaG
VESRRNPLTDDPRKAIGETVQGLADLGLPTTFTKKQLDQLGVTIPDVEVSPARIREIQQKTRLDQTVFAEALNVSVSRFGNGSKANARPLARPSSCSSSCKASLIC